MPVGVCSCRVIGFTPMGGGYPDQPDYEQDPSCPIHGDTSPRPGYSGILNSNEPWHHDYGTTQGKDTPMHDTSVTTAAPAVATETEYGVRRADGTIDWAKRDEQGWVTYQAPSGDTYQIATGDRFETSRARDLLRALAHYTENTAKGAGLPYTDEQAPTLVARRVTTLTDEPFTAMALGPETPADEPDLLEF